MLNAKLCPALSFRNTTKPNHIELYRNRESDSRTVGFGSHCKHGKISCSGMDLIMGSNPRVSPPAQPPSIFEPGGARDVPRRSVISLAFGGRDSAILSKKT